MNNRLDKILKDKQREVNRLLDEVSANSNHPFLRISNENQAPGNHFSNALKSQNFAVIAEVKRRSPSVGEISQIKDPVRLALNYCEGGASAISVLTESENFGGSLEDLRQVAEAVSLHYPNCAVLRKDFIIHPLQLAEAVSAGAHAILLIVNVLGNKLKSFINEAKRLGLESLVEVHDLKEFEIAIEAEAPIIGINHRNLTSFEIDFDNSYMLRPMILPHVITVAESGIHNPEQAKRMRDLGFNAILVGEALVRAEDPSKLISLMKGENDEG